MRHRAEEWLTHQGSVGRAVIGELRICSPTGEVLPPGGEGEIYFANSPDFTYHNDPVKTAESRNRRGWRTLGDIGYVDENGFLYITDRKNFTIISGGVKIYPQEIENLLITHPALVDAAVFGIPDADLGERVAVMQPSHPAAAGPELARELEAFYEHA